MSELDRQVGGNHYKLMPFQPIEFSYLAGLNFLEGCVVKYITRYKNKNGLNDLEKAIHYCRVIQEFEYLRYKSGWWSIIANLMHHLKRKFIGKWNFYHRRKITNEFCTKNNLSTHQIFIIYTIIDHDCENDLESIVQLIENMIETEKRVGGGWNADIPKS